MKNKEMKEIRHIQETEENDIEDVIDLTEVGGAAWQMTSQRVKIKRKVELESERPRKRKKLENLVDWGNSVQGDDTEEDIRKWLLNQQDHPGVVQGDGHAGREDLGGRQQRMRQLDLRNFTMLLESRRMGTQDIDDGYVQDGGGEDDSMATDVCHGHLVSQDRLEPQK